MPTVRRGNIVAAVNVARLSIAKLSVPTTLARFRSMGLGSLAASKSRSKTGLAYFLGERRAKYP
jgi:hypothetical protein